MGPSFFSRWSQRKQAVADAQSTEVTDQVCESEALFPTPLSENMASPQLVTPPEAAESTAQAPIAQEVEPLTDADMPEIASLDGNSNVSAFFSEGVSEKLRQKALTALFLKPEFNLRDGLEDYDDDYSQLTEMGQALAAEVRQWVRDKPSEVVEQWESDLSKPPSTTGDAPAARVEPDPSAGAPESLMPVAESVQPESEVVEVETALSQSDLPQGSESASDKMPHIS
ncbi:Protein of unknown function [Oceanospirillum multiglobuliferum]|uniref:DUF3306 domain-containing protein n=1 Tax=Oceanospirillum multiglobuliferum TaxID=64969 RepID=A0A1T4S714_9GAMM|nr:DUF3306 domain-containing protein [Oceanospirillum multiglobuliferum]OPX54418.1 hypothetical protein BTE48_14400 [Oceanospirillum multiglobuliferum]SKA24049.1 Protein of unknown function [Oceanospirillum multiglobuliferum]